MLDKEYGDLLTELGNRIRSVRLSKRITQSHLSFTCDMEKSSISKIESGKVNVSYMTLLRLSNGLEVPVVELCC